MNINPSDFAEWLSIAMRSRPNGKVGEVAGEVAALAYDAGRQRMLESVVHWLITGPYGASIAAHSKPIVADLRSAMKPLGFTPTENPINCIEDLEKLTAVVLDNQFKEALKGLAERLNKSESEVLRDALNYYSNSVSWFEILNSR